MDIKEYKVVAENGKRNHPWEYARCVVVNSILKKHLTSADSHPDVLDRGCGDIFFVNDFCRRHPHFHPIAIDTAFDTEIMASLHTQHPELDIDLYNDVTQVNNCRQASLVLLLDVLEHIEKDADFLHLVTSQAYITHDTVFMITVPAFQSLYVQRDKWLGHYRRYSRKQLCSMVSNAGLRVTESGYFFTFPALVRRFQKMMERSAAKPEAQQEGIGNWNKGTLATTAFKAALLADYYLFRLFHLLGIKVPGLSTYVVCRPDKQ